jgi:hypothetical protein
MLDLQFQVRPEDGAKQDAGRKSAGVLFLNRFIRAQAEPGLSWARRRAGVTARDYSSGTMSSATMLMILMSGFTAGPAVSL